MSIVSRHEGRHRFEALETKDLTAQALTLTGGSVSVLRIAKVPLAAGTGAGGVLAWANPEGVPILVHDLVLDVTTEATGTPTVDAGIAADAETASDTLIDGAAVGTAAVTVSSSNAAGANGGRHRRMAADEVLTVTASADPAGLAGSAYVAYSLL